jgi:hypothetical protein
MRKVDLGFRALVNSRLQSPNISKSYSFLFVLLRKKEGKKEGCSGHISLSLSLRVGLFFPFLLGGFLFLFLGL